MKEPKLLDDVKRILDGVFSDGCVQRALDNLLNERKTNSAVKNSEPEDDPDEDENQ